MSSESYQWGFELSSDEIQAINESSYAQGIHESTVTSEQIAGEKLLLGFKVSNYNCIDAYDAVTRFGNCFFETIAFLKLW